MSHFKEIPHVIEHAKKLHQNSLYAKLTWVKFIFMVIGTAMTMRGKRTSAIGNGRCIIVKNLYLHQS